MFLVVCYFYIIGCNVGDIFRIELSLASVFVEESYNFGISVNM